MFIFNFASESSEVAKESAEGLAAFGVNWQSLLIQAITFLLVVLVLKKFVVGKLSDMIDARRDEINKGIDATKQAQQELAKAQDKIDVMLAEARDNAELIVKSAKSESADIVKKAEEKANLRAEAIVADAKSKLDNDLNKARAELKSQSARLISEVSAVLIGQKLDSKTDSELIEKELNNRNA